jgi:hypothetical protein
VPSANADAPTSLSTLPLLGLHAIGESTDEALPPTGATGSRVNALTSADPFPMPAAKLGGKREAPPQNATPPSELTRRPCPLVEIRSAYARDANA